MSLPLSLLNEVQEKYAAVARSSLSSEHAGIRAIAEAFGYSEEELSGLPADANMGLSCGNPVATANLRQGEVVIDLGCGGGIDVLLASRKVGTSGRAIGIDMTPEMLARANANAVQFGKGSAPANVEFHQSRIDKIPLADATADCIISNCVINLAPDKSAVFAEMHRVLKLGGRVAVSDIGLKKPLPEEIRQDVMAYVGCIGGALLLSDYDRMLKEAGFQDVAIIDTKKDLNAYAMAEASACCTPSMNEPTSCFEPKPGVHESLGELLKKYDVNEYACSVQVYALKPIS